MVRVLFVCLGNICRSPMAEGIFQQMVDQAGLADQIQVDSAGTGSWHVGESAHRGTLDILSRHGISYNGRARTVRRRDFEDYDYVIAMDRNNLADLNPHKKDHLKMQLLLDYAENTNKKDVPDPYYNGNFEEVYLLVEDGCRGLLASIRKVEKI